MNLNAPLTQALGWQGLVAYHPTASLHVLYDIITPRTRGNSPGPSPP